MLFKNEPFVSHARVPLNFKIDCDALTEADWKTLAAVVSNRFKFGEVYGIPMGGIKFMEALQQYASGNTEDPLLIVDDVLTTGASFQETYDELDLPVNCEVIGVVVFSRASYKMDGIYSIFQLWDSVKS